LIDILLLYVFFYNKFYTFKDVWFQIFKFKMSCKFDFIVSIYNLIMIFCFSCMSVNNLFIYLFYRKTIVYRK